ncbi:MAG: PorV/PorQ family protein [Bacteroidota bacterium]
MRAALLLLLVSLVGTVLSSGPAFAQSPLPSYGEDRRGTSGFQFLKVAVDPRTAALGESVVSHADDVTALLHNPALIARAGDVEGALTFTNYYVDTQLYWAGGLYRLGPYTLGLSLQAFDSGELVERTEVSGPDGTGRTFRLLDLGVGLTVSQALTDLFSYGVTVKYARESVLDVVTQAALLDLGVAYSVGETGVRLGVAIRNFGLDGRPSGEVSYLDLQNGEPVTVTGDEFARVTPPTTFLLGVSYDLLRGLNALGLTGPAGPQHDFRVSGQLTNPNDDTERFNLGLEYTWNRVLTLRGGYQLGIEEATLPSFGLGVRAPGYDGVRLDYGFNRLDRLGAVHRVGFLVSFD